MNIATLTNAGLLMLHESIRIAREQDDQVEEKHPFEIRENPEWKQWSSEIATELVSRGVTFPTIEW